MPQRIRSNILERRSNRLRLPVAPKPRFVSVSAGVCLGYRRRAGGGSWICRVADGRGSSWQRVFASADDFEESNGQDILTYVEAVDKARLLARGQDREGGPPGTVATALADYETNLRARGGKVGNVLRLRRHLPAGLLSHPVALLESRELQKWRNGLLDRMKPGSANRTASVLRAVLNAAAEHDTKLASQAAAWRLGLKAIKHKHEPRNVVLTDDEVCAVVAAAYEEESSFGLLVEVAAQTGSRPSQISRLTVADLQDGRAVLLVPRSAKGRSGNIKATERRPVPITASLAAKLREAATGRDPDAPLLTKPNGTAWRTEPAEHRHPFARTVAHVGLDPSVVTIYALRHSAITRSLLAGTPVRVVAANCDTSTAIIEKTYSRYIADHADTVARRGLLETETPGANVVPLAERRA